MNRSSEMATNTCGLEPSGWSVLRSGQRSVRTNGSLQAIDNWLHLESRMRSIFRIASPWCFFVLLAFSIAPRQLFHHCAAADEHVAHSSTNAYHADCPVCDVAIPVASAGGRIASNGVLELFVVFFARPQNTPFLVPAFRVPARGPPSVS